MIGKFIQRFFAKTIHYFRTINNLEKLFLTVSILIGLLLVFIFKFSIYGIFHEISSDNSEFKEGLFEEVNTLNPLFANNESELSISFLLYPPLLPHTDNNKSLVLKHIEKSEDGLNYFIEIDTTKKWSDGTKLSIDDIDLSFQLYQSFGPKNIRDYLKNITFEIINEQSGVFKLKFNDNLFLQRLTQIQIFPSKWWRKFSQEEWSFNSDLYRVGFYYYLIEWQKNQNKKEITLIKNNHIPELQNVFQKIKFIIYPDYITAFHSLLLKEIDALANVKPESVSLLSTRRFKIYNLSLPKIILIIFNREKITNPTSLNIDRNEINKKIFSNFGEPLTGIFPKALRTLLQIPQPTSIQTSNNEDKEQIILISPNEGIVSVIAKLIAQNNKIEIKFIPQSNLMKTIENKEYSAIILGIDYGFPPNIPYFWSKLGLFFNNVEDKYLEKQFQNLILEPEESITQTWQNIENSLLEKNYNIPIIKPPFIYAVNAKIKVDIPDFLPNSAYRFINIYNWQ